MPDISVKIVLGFDFGLKRIGVAIGQMVTKTATPLTILKAHDGVPNWQEIANLVKEWGVDAFVVGLPINMDGTEQPITQRAKKFGQRLSGRFNLPIFFMDERLTTIAAKAEMHETLEGSARFEATDSMAAKLIVESWLRSE